MITVGQKKVVVDNLNKCFAAVSNPPNWANEKFYKSQQARFEFWFSVADNLGVNFNEIKMSE